MVTVLKLGGSVVTHKDDPETIDENALASAADAISRAVSHGRTQSEDRDGSRDGRQTADLVIVHGGGSFGHHYAAKHGVSSTDGTTDAKAVTEIHAAMGRLNRAVVMRLQAEGVDALPVRPLSVAHRNPSGLDFPVGQIRSMLEEGFVPVVHGDVVVHEGRGATILSGDDIVVTLARSLDADSVGLCSTVPGVLDDEDEVIEEIHALEDVAQYLGGSDATDVTGGMSKKVETLLELESEASIFALADLDTFLKTGSAGTVLE